MKIADACLVKPGSKLKLADRDPGETFGLNKEQAVGRLKENVERLTRLQYVLYAENKRSLLVVFQAMDAAGKDGAIRNVMTGLNPQGCRVASFKAPTKVELDHDFLWRIHKEVPPRGEVGIFNRSHYEDVLVVRVHNLVAKQVWSRRYQQINAFESILCDNGTKVIKFFLHISKDEQKKRFEARLKDPDRNWKFSPADIEERKYWDQYMEAYEEAMSKCSTREAPWYVIPANKKWFRNAAVSQIVADTLEEMDLKFPPPSFDLGQIKIE